MSVESSIKVSHYQQAAIWRKNIRKDRCYIFESTSSFWLGFFDLLIVTLVGNTYKMYSDWNHLKLKYDGNFNLFI